jgi:hypothetical protein
MRRGKHHGLFECSRCGLLENADRNGAFNIGRRALGQVSKVGAVVDQPITGALSLSGLEVSFKVRPQKPPFLKGVVHVIRW